MKLILHNDKVSHLILVCLRIFILLGLILYPTSVVAAKVLMTTGTSLLQKIFQLRMASFEQTSDQLKSFSAPLTHEYSSATPVNGPTPIELSKSEPRNLPDDNVMRPAGVSPDAKTDQIIIKYKENQIQGNGINPASKDQIQRLSASVGFTLKYVREMSGGSHILRLPTKLSSTAFQVIIEKLNALPEVEYAETDFIMQHTFVPNDPYYSSQWGYFSPTPGNYGINAPAAWDITTGLSSVVVAVVDTGITGHTEFSGRTVFGYDFISDSLVANDGDGRDSNPSDPGDWITSAENVSGYFEGCEVSNSSWHGTHVAGMIAASSNNGDGVAGINWSSKILPVRVLGKCGGYNSDIIDGMRWAAGLSVLGVPGNSNPAKVINLSLGGKELCTLTLQTTINEIRAAGTTIVVAAGNNNDNASLYAPGNCSGVITVSATDRYGDRSWYSNYGSAVEISAPGGDTTNSPTNGILSTLNTGTQGPIADTYAYYQGTSMATPQVSGIASLLYSMNPSFTPSQILSILQSNVTVFPPGSTCSASLCGTGIVNAGSAVLATSPTSYSLYLPLILRAGQNLIAFNKTSPANTANNQPISPSLSWQSASPVTLYEYCYDTTNDGTCSNWISNGTVTSVQLPVLLENTAYSWQVRAWNGSTGPIYADGSLSAFWVFTTSTIQNPIQNGGFESGDVVWTEISTNGWDLIVNTTQDLPLSPHNGSWLTWLGGDASEISRISQTVTIPAGRSILHFWLYTASADYYCGEDVFGILIGSNDDVVYSQWVCDSNDTYGWVHKTVDLTSYVGQTREIKFLAGLDAAFNSNIWVDDISLETTTSLSASISENVILDRSDLDTTSLARIELIKEKRFSEIAIPNAGYTEKYEEGEMINQEIRILKNQLLTE